MVDLEAPDADLGPARLEPQDGPGAQLATAKRAGHDRTPAADRKCPVNGEAEGPTWCADGPGEDAIPKPDDAPADLVDALARRRRRDEHHRARERGPRQEGRHVFSDLGRPRLAGDIDLRHDRDPVADRERIQQFEVFECLGPDPVVGRDDEECGIDLAGPDEHVADERVMSRHVDEVDRGPVLEVEVGIADVDRHPPPPLLGQAIGIDPGQRSEQRRLAVIDMPGRADDDGHARLSCPRRHRGRGRSPPRAPRRHLA